MELTEIVRWALYVITGVVSWFIKLLWNGQKQLKLDLEKERLNIAENYLKKDDFKQVIAEFKNDLRDNLRPMSDKINSIEHYLRDRIIK